MKGKRVLITGGAGGMGLATARRIAGAGARLALADIDSERLAAAADELGCATLTADVRGAAACRAAVDGAARALGGLDMLINCAGVWWEGASETMPEDEYDRLLDVNLKGAYFLSAAAIPHLVASGGQMIHIASDAGLIGNRGAAAYCASKGGLVLLVKALALELAEKGVRVNAICPADVETPMLEHQANRFGNGEPEAYRAALKALYPQGARTRFVRADEVASFILAVAGIEAITGAALQIDFGTTAGK